MADYLIIEGALGEIALSAVEPRDEDAVTPAVATLVLTAVSPEIASGGVDVVQPAAATMALSAVSPEVVSGGVEAVAPAVATMELIAVSPVVLPSVIFRGAVLGTFGVEPYVKADDWDVEPLAIADEFGVD